MSAAQPPTSAPDPLVGRVFADRYRIIARLGSGAMGAVYLGEHLRMGRRDAIKVLRDGLARDDEAIARFTRGARNVAAIRHPNVCTIYDFSDTSEGFRYLAMEFVEGETLRETLEREGRLDLRRATVIAIQVAEALQAAHEAGVVHRDLKPANIMLCRRPDGSDAVKVVDFDIAKGPGEPEGEELTRAGFVVGTPEYMSPEQLTGDPLDGRSDIYSLAVVIFRMLTGALPFRAATAQEIMIQRLTSEPLTFRDVLPDVPFPDQLQQVLTRSLSRNAAQRPATAAELAAWLRRAVEPGAAVSATAPPGPVPAAAELPPTRIAPVLQPTSARSRAALTSRPVLIAGAVVLLVAAAAAMNGLLRDEPAALDDPIPQQSVPELLSQPGGADTNPEATSPAAPPAREVQSPPTTPLPTGGGRAALGDIDTLLNRYLDALSRDPSPAALRAMRDTAAMAWEDATTQADRAKAALVLAQAALTAGDLDSCARWAGRGAEFGQASAFEMLLEVCR